MAGSSLPQPSVESCDLSEAIYSPYIPLTESDRGDGPIYEVRFMVPVSSVSAEDFTDIISKHHMVKQNVHIWLAEK